MFSPTLLTLLCSNCKLLSIGKHAISTQMLRQAYAAEHQVLGVTVKRWLGRFDLQGQQQAFAGFAAVQFLQVQQHLLMPLQKSACLKLVTGKQAAAIVAACIPVHKDTYHHMLFERMRYKTCQISHSSSHTSLQFVH